MMTVKILINGKEILSEDLVNITTKMGGEYKVGNQCYRLNDGSFIWFPYGSAIGLARALLEMLENEQGGLT